MTVVGYTSASVIRLYAKGNGEGPRLMGMLDLGDVQLTEAQGVEITLALAELHDAASKIGRRRALPPAQKPPSVAHGPMELATAAQSPRERYGLIRSSKVAPVVLAHLEAHGPRRTVDIA